MTSPTLTDEATDRPMEAVRRLAPRPEDDRPVIIVGLPRSGSSFLAHLLGHVDDLWVFDDYYPLQKAQAIALDRGLDPEELARYVDRLAWETRARVKWEQDFRAPDLTLDEIDRAEQALLRTFEGDEPFWYEVAAEWMVRLARHHGRSQWGYKTPQDFFHLDRLARIWPNARIVHLVRDPRQIMRSLKNLEVHPGGDGDPRQYHPAVTPLYWKQSMELVDDFRRRSSVPVHRVEFERLRREPEAVVAEMAELVGSTWSTPPVAESVNTSSARAVASITPTSTWLAERLVGERLEAAGYERSSAAPRLRDVPELVRVTSRFGWFQARRVVADPEKRASVLTFVRRLVGR